MLRVAELQAVDGHRYALMARAQRLRTVTLPATRGSILDSSGNILATNIITCEVTADPTLIPDHAVAARDLAPSLGVPAATVLARLSVRGRFAVLASGLTPAQGRAVVAQVHHTGVAGVFVVNQSQRVYPDGTLARGVVGFVGAGGFGLAGLEYTDNSLLTGRSGSLTAEVDPMGGQIPTAGIHEVPPVSGTSIELTINRDIQYLTQTDLAAQVRATRAQLGMAVVLDPRTGAVLALASAGPSSALKLSDPTVSDIYEPGSVNKLVMASAALQQGLLTPTSVITVPPRILVAGTYFHDAEPHGIEHLTFTGVLAQSSNIGTIEIAQRLGRATLYHYLRAYGLGSPTGVGLPGESAGLLPPPALWSGTQAATIPFGQGIGVTAIQVAQMYATLANGGLHVQPHVVAGTIGPSGVLAPAILPAPVRVVSRQTAATLRAMLESVETSSGTAPLAAIPGYLVAGKTGTANIADRHGTYRGFTASYVGMAPANHPQLVVEVVLVRPQTNVYGGSVAAPVFHEIMGYALQRLGIPPSNVPPARFPIYG